MTDDELRHDPAQRLRREGILSLEWPKAGLEWPKGAWAAVSLDADPSDVAAATLDAEAPLVLQLGAEWAASGDVEARVRAFLDAFGRDRAAALVLVEPEGLDGIDALAAAWAGMERVRASGLVEQLGIRHAGRRLLEALLERCSTPPAFDELELHPYWHDAELVAFCRSRGVAVHAVCSAGPRLADSGEYAFLDDPVLGEIAAAHGVGPIAVAHAWGLARADGLHLLRGDLEHLASEETRLPTLALSRDELERIDGLHCDWRVLRDTRILNCIYWDGSSADTLVTETDASGLEYGLYKRCYLQVSGSQRVNRRVSELIWRWVFNLPATLQYRLRSKKMSPVAERLADEFLRDGFTATSLDELGLGHLLEEMQPELERAKSEVRDRESADPQNDYRHSYPSPLASQVANCEIVRQIADRYLGMKALRDQLPPAMRVIPGRRHPASEQQLWHIDVEDFCVMKTFLLLDDLDADTKGCLEYVKGSHPFGPLADEAAELSRVTWVHDPEPGYTHQVKNPDLLLHVRPDLVQRLGGKKGTVLIFDARGLHRGGHVLEGWRAHTVNTYYSPNPIHPWHLRRSLWNLLWSPFRWQTNMSKNQPYDGWPPTKWQNFKTFTGELWESVGGRLGRG